MLEPPAPLIFCSQGAFRRQAFMSAALFAHHCGIIPAFGPTFDVTNHFFLCNYYFQIYFQPRQCIQHSHSDSHCQQKTPSVESMRTKFDPLSHSISHAFRIPRMAFAAETLRIGGKDRITAGFDQARAEIEACNVRIVSKDGFLERRGWIWRLVCHLVSEQGGPS